MYLIEGETEIRAAQRQLEAALQELPHLGPCRIGYKTGAKTAELFGHGKGRFYGGTKVVAEGRKFWNVFGILTSPEETQNIVVEVNLDLRDRRPAGFVARGAEGQIFLLHSGVMGGGVKGIGKTRFLEWLGEQPVVVEKSGRKPLSGVVVAKLDALDTAASVERFVEKVHRFKTEMKQRPKS